MVTLGIEYYDDYNDDREKQDKNVDSIKSEEMMAQLTSLTPQHSNPIDHLCHSAIVRFANSLLTADSWSVNINSLLMQLKCANVNHAFLKLKGKFIKDVHAYFNRFSGI